MLEQAVHLVAEEPGLMLAAQADQLLLLLLCQKGACRIMWKIHDHRLQSCQKLMRLGNRMIAVGT